MVATIVTVVVFSLTERGYGDGQATDLVHRIDREQPRPATNNAAMIQELIYMVGIDYVLSCGQPRCL